MRLGPVGSQPSVLRVQALEAGMSRTDEHRHPSEVVGRRTRRHGHGGDLQPLRNRLGDGLCSDPLLGDRVVASAGFSALDR